MNTEVLEEKKLEVWKTNPFIATELLVSIFIDLHGVCARIWFKEKEKTNPDLSIIKKYNELDEEIRLADVPSNFKDLDTMNSVLDKYLPVLKAARQFEEENYEPYVNLTELKNISL